MDEKKTFLDEIREAKANNWDNNMRYNYRCNANNSSGEELMVTITLAEYREIISTSAKTSVENKTLKQVETALDLALDINKKLERELSEEREEHKKLKEAYANLLQKFNQTTEMLEGSDATLNPESNLPF